MGTQRCAADATAYAFVGSVLCPHFTSPLRTRAQQHANLLAYNTRLTRELYPQLA
jgi:hypothetical protein